MRLAPCALAALLPWAAPAQTVPFAVPEAPAFTFLGVNPTKIARPGTTRDLAVTLLSGVDSGGRVLQGFALDATLWTLVPGFDVPLEKVQGRGFGAWLRYVLANAQLSLATARPQGDTASTDVGFGLRLTLLDQGDPMLDAAFTRAFGERLRRCAPDAPDEGAAPACLVESSRQLREDWLGRHWNALRVSVGAGTGFRAVRSELANRRRLGWSAWAAGAAPFGRLQVLGQIQYDRRRAIGAVPAARTLSYGARANYGGGTANAFLEVLGLRRFAAPAGVDGATGSWSAGVEFRAAENLWLSTGVGSAFADATKADRVLIIAGVRWAITDAARFADP